VQGVDVAAGIGLGADTPRNLFEELNFESRTGLGRGQNYARKKIDLTLKHLVRGPSARDSLAFFYSGRSKTLRFSSSATFGRVANRYAH
jgi:hypothetical protein